MINPSKTTFVVGPALLWCGWAAAAMGIGCLVWQGLLWPIMALGLAAIVTTFYDFKTLRRQCEGIDIRRRLPAVAARDAPFTSAVYLENKNPLPAILKLRDVLPGDACPDYVIQPARVAAGARQELETALRIPVRGRHAFGPIYVRLRGRLGMLERQWPVDCRGEIRILPDSAATRDGLTKDVLADRRLLDQLTRTRLRGEGTEFESLSEFREGDDPRRIDWRSTARRNYPILRRFQLEQHRDLIVVVDCGRLMGAAAGALSADAADQAANGADGSKLDRAIDSALMLSRVALGKGDRCGVGIFADRTLGYLPPLMGPHAMDAITGALYDLQPRWRESNFGDMFATLQARRPKRSLIVVLSDLADSDTSQRTQLALATLARRHVVIFAALQTPVLEGRLETPTRTTRDVARQVVIFRLLRERERALHALRRQGVFVLDVQPRHLTVPLINQYILLREKNLV